MILGGESGPRSARKPETMLAWSSRPHSVAMYSKSSVASSVLVGLEQPEAAAVTLIAVARIIASRQNGRQLPIAGRQSPVAGRQSPVGSRASPVARARERFSSEDDCK